MTDLQTYIQTDRHTDEVIHRGAPLLNTISKLYTIKQKIVPGTVLNRFYPVLTFVLRVCMIPWSNTRCCACVRLKNSFHTQNTFHSLSNVDRSYCSCLHWSRYFRPVIQLKDWMKGFAMLWVFADFLYRFNCGLPVGSILHSWGVPKLMFFRLDRVNSYTWPCVWYLIKCDLSSVHYFTVAYNSDTFTRYHTASKVAYTSQVTFQKGTRTTLPCLSGRVVVYCIGILSFIKRLKHCIIVLQWY